MAFDIAGLGGTFAAGLLGGAQSAQKERERLSAEREKDYLRTYTQLISSGEWAPADVSKGVSDGGVLKVGPWFLTEKKAAGLGTKEMLQLAQARKAEAEIPGIGVQKAPYKGQRDYRDVNVQGPEGKGEVAAKQPTEWDGEKWVDIGRPVITTKPPVEDWKTFIDNTTGAVAHIKKGTKPPPNMVPAPTFIGGERLGMARGESEAKAYVEKGNQAEQVMRANAMLNRLPPAEEGVVAEGQKEYKNAFIDYGGNVAGATAARQGLTGNQLEMAVEMGRRAAEKKYNEQRSTTPAEVKNWVDEVLDKYKAFFQGGVGKQTAGIEAAVEEEQQKGPMVRKKIPSLKERVLAPPMVRGKINR